MHIRVYTSAFLAVSAIALAAPASADDDPTMPDVTGAVLSSAKADIGEVTKEAIELSNVNGPSQTFYNTTEWFVCSQSPSAGATLSGDDDISLNVRRPGTSCPE